MEAQYTDCNTPECVNSITGQYPWATGQPAIAEGSCVAMQVDGVQNGDWALLFCGKNLNQQDGVPMIVMAGYVCKKPATVICINVDLL